MTTEEKRTNEVVADLRKLPEGVLIRLCARLIVVAEPEKFKWDELKIKLGVRDEKTNK